MMFKCLLCIIVTVLSVLPVECWYRSESCMTGNRAGSCIRLCNCPSLVNEIKRAGNPMPSYLRRKLQHLGCGFDDDEPLVCCSSYSNNNDGEQGDQTLNYIPDTWSTPRPIDQSETNVNFNPISNDPYNNVRGEEDNNNNSNDNNESNKPISDVRNHRNLDLLSNDCGAIESDRVFGGNRTRLFEMPWMVLLSYDSARGSQLSCGGTLITQWYVLTAAHCVSFLGSRLNLRNVILGEYDTRKDPDCERNEGQLFCAPKIRKVRIDSVIAHSGYTPQNLRDDIALLRLAEPADFSLDSMKPICLPITSELQSERLEGLQGVVAGWGATEDGLQSPVLLSVDLPIITNRECQNIYNGSPQIYETQLCAGGVPDKDSCGGDSGGPLLYPGRSRGVGVRYVQRGIVSYGSKRCGVGGFPGVYTRVVNYMDWILDNISN